MHSRPHFIQRYVGQLVGIPHNIDCADLAILDVEGGGLHNAVAVDADVLLLALTPS